MITPLISLQLATLQEDLAQDLRGAVARLAEIGFQTVEPFNFVDISDELKQALDDHGITARTGHAFLLSTEVHAPDGSVIPVPSLEETFAAAQRLGLEFVIDPYVPAAAWMTRAAIEGTAARLNEIAQQAAAFGLRVGYHNHDHEFRSIIDGRPAYEIFAELTDDQVCLEVDLYWATAAGTDVIALLERLGERVVAVHAKDGPMRADISISPLPRDQRPAGQGAVDLAGAINAAPNLRYVVVEFDHYDGDIFEGISQSFRWLSSHTTQEVSA